MKEAQITTAANRLSHAIGDAVSDLVSGWAMAEAWREGRGADCDDVLERFRVLTECDAIDLVMEKIRTNQ